MTVYLEPEVQKALRLKAAETERNMSALVNDAVRVMLAEDLEDLRAIDERAVEPSRPFEDFLEEISDGGLL